MGTPSPWRLGMYFPKQFGGGRLKGLKGCIQRYDDNIFWIRISLPTTYFLTNMGRGKINTGDGLGPSQEDIT